MPLDDETFDPIFCRTGISELEAVSILMNILYILILAPSSRYNKYEHN